MITWEQIYQILATRTPDERAGTALAFSKFSLEYYEIETIVVWDKDNDVTDGYPYLVIDDN